MICKSACAHMCPPSLHLLYSLLQGGKQALDHIEELAKKESIRIGNLIGRILVKKYPLAPSDTFEVIVDELIEWDFWPCFLKISCENGYYGFSS